MYVDISLTQYFTLIRNRKSRALNTVNSDACTKAESHAAAFIREKLGEDKWNIFSARLFERRLGTRPSSKSRSKDLSYVDSRNGGASAIEFMVKVEIVKEVLRTYVPWVSWHYICQNYSDFHDSHPYNPLKSLNHEYAASPTGNVTLTRSTVLALSGWSNTQFSYWARRVEAVSVLAPRDERLRTLAAIFKERLRDALGTESISAHFSRSEEESSEASGSLNSNSALPSVSSSCYQQDAQGMTGKGLDILIDDVKKQTGASQFLRGKHSSLDPFGAIYLQGENGRELSGPIFKPTFQAVEYGRSSPPSNTQQREKRKSKGKIQPNPYIGSDIGVGGGQRPQAAIDIDIDVPFTVTDLWAPFPPYPHASQEHVPPPPINVPTNLNAMSRSHCAGGITRAQPNTQTCGRHQKHPSRRRELFPVSDSRPELENIPHVYKRSGDTIELVPKKRTRQSDWV